VSRAVAVERPQRPHDRLLDDVLDRLAAVVQASRKALQVRNAGEHVFGLHGHGVSLAFHEVHGNCRGVLQQKRGMPDEESVTEL